MTTHIEIDIPVYRSDRYEQLKKRGKITLSSVVDTLEEGSLTKGYNRLKKEVEILIADINARTRLAEEVGELEDQIRWKSVQLKDLLNDTEKAKNHLDTLSAFLENLGIDPKTNRLTIDTELLLSLSQAGSQVQVAKTEIYPGPGF